MSVEVVNQTITLQLDVAQGPAGAPPRVSITDIEYDGSDRVIAYTMNDVEHVVSYVTNVDLTVTVTDVGGGTTRVTTLDAAGRIISATIS